MIESFPVYMVFGTDFNQSTNVTIDGRMNISDVKRPVGDGR